MRGMMGMMGMREMMRMRGMIDIDEREGPRAPFPAPRLTYVEKIRRLG
jgi:hypothetical protein